VTPSYAVSFYLPTIIVQAGFDDPVTANLMASPVWLLAAAVIIVNAGLADRTGRRDRHVIVPAFLAAVGFTMLGIGNMYNNFGLQYAAMFIACPTTVCLIPTTLAWMTDTIRGSTRTSVAHAMAVGAAPRRPLPGRASDQFVRLTGMNRIRARRVAGATTGIGNIGGMIGPMLYSSLATCAYDNGERGPLGEPCPQPQDRPDLCTFFPDRTYDCPFGTSYLYAHFSMAGWAFLAFAFGLLVKFFAAVDEEVRPRCQTYAADGARR